MKLLSNDDWGIHCEILRAQENKIEDLSKENKEQLQIILMYEKICELIATHSNYRLYAIANKRSKHDSISNHELGTVIVLIDKRRKVSIEYFRKSPLSLKSSTPNNGGELELYAINAEMYHNLRYETSLVPKCNIPYIQVSVDYTEVETTIRIDEFHSRFSFSDYRGNGYGALLLDSLVDFLINNEKNSSPSLPIRLIGLLSSEDIKEDNDINIRNGFYKSKGFHLTSMSEDGKNGQIGANLDEIKTKANESELARFNLQNGQNS